LAGFCFRISAVNQCFPVTALPSRSAMLGGSASIILRSKKSWYSPPSAVSQLAETRLKQIGWQQFVRYLILISAISVHQRQVFVRSG